MILVEVVEMLWRTNDDGHDFANIRSDNRMQCHRRLQSILINRVNLYLALFAVHIAEPNSFSIILLNRECPFRRIAWKRWPPSLEG